MATTGNKNVIKTDSHMNSKLWKYTKQMRMAAFSSELAVLTHCLRDLIVPTDLWMLKNRQALAMWLKPTMKSVHIDLCHSNRDIASNLLAVRWMQQHLLRNPVPIWTNKLTALPCYNNNFCCSMWK
jgi:hypothetical protein